MPIMPKIKKQLSKQKAMKVPSPLYALDVNTSLHDLAPTDIAFLLGQRVAFDDGYLSDNGDGMYQQLTAHGTGYRPGYYY